MDDFFLPRVNTGAVSSSQPKSGQKLATFGNSPIFYEKIFFDRSSIIV